MLRHDDGEAVADIMRAPLVVAGLMPLPEALAQMTVEREHLACVIDEYGGFAGVLTFEDLAEGPDPGLVAEAERVWRAGGDVHLDEVARTIGHDLPEGDYETLSGLLIAHLGTLAETGETTRVPLPADPADLASEHPQRRFIDLEVLGLARHVPSDLRLQLVEEVDGDTDGPDDERSEA